MVSVNGCRISGRLLSAIMATLGESSLWSRLRYSAIPQNEGGVLALELQCQLFSAIAVDLSCATFNSVDSVHFEFGYFTSEVSVSIEMLVSALLRSLASLVLNLEYRYPFVFSFYGRELLYTNYNWLIKDIHELQRGSITSRPSTVFEQDTNVIFVLILSSMQRRILSEFNTLNIMKECDASAPRRSRCRKQMEKTADEQLPSTNIKNKVLDLRILDVGRVEAMLRQ